VRACVRVRVRVAYNYMYKLVKLMNTVMANIFYYINKAKYASNTLLVIQSSSLLMRCFKSY